MYHVLFHYSLYHYHCETTRAIFAGGPDFVKIEKKIRKVGKKMEQKQVSMQAMQQEVDDFIRQFKTGYFSPLAQLARLTEEVGELAREINHYYGEKTKKNTEHPKTMTDELGDVLFVVISLANSLDIDLEQAFAATMTKFHQRDQYRFVRKDEE